MSFNLSFSSKSQKQIKRLPQEIKEKIKIGCEEILKNPWHKQTIKVQGYENIRRKRVGKWRILYLVDKKSREILIVKIELRDENIYKL
jgi:mRNA-degrading endonuclease RelE of RelBE toxin-antitoxin system